MKKGVFLFLALIILIQPVVTGQIEESIKGITYQAEQYEAGNINYAQLIVYTASLRQGLTKTMGATSLEHDPILKAGQLEKALGKPTETTRWVWVETSDGDGHEKKLDNEVPAWRKPIFDGKKIQMFLSAWPNIGIKDGEEVLFYRLHLDINFKSQEEQPDIKEKIDKIKSLAEEYSKNPNKENMEILASQSVSVEQSFNKYFNQNPAKCEELMTDIFGSENKMEDQNTLVWEINLYEGSNFDAIMRFEMCENCNWQWISPNMRIEGRGPKFSNLDDSGDFNLDLKEKFSSFTAEDYKQETKKLIDEIKAQIETGDYQSAMEKSQEFRILTESWNEKANDVWQELDEKYQNFWQTMSEEEQRKCQETYCWIKREQERREEEKQLRKANYDERRGFYSELFSIYVKKEFYYEQEQWEKRIVEEFKEFGEEMCSNNIDDNDNGQIDCSDSQCGGRICGYDTVMRIGEDNLSIEEQIELYCIAGTCQAKEEIVKEEIIICGNHICEENEQETCAQDCTSCFQHEPLECSGDVIFSGTSEEGCPLAPICLAEDLFCETDDDCINPLCGDASCIEGTCRITQLTECKESECADGERKISKCLSGEEIVTEGCINGAWKETGVECEEIIEAEIEIEEEIAGDKCIVKSDCGNEDDVCSNGICITLPKSVKEHKEQEVESPEVESNNEEEFNEVTSEENQEEIPELQENEIQTEQGAEIAGNVVFSFFRTLGKIAGFLIEEDNPDGENQDGGVNEGDGQGEEIVEEENNENEDDMRDYFADNFEENRNEDRERRQNECNERCGRECYDREIRPCVEDCIFEDCGEELECDVDKVRVSCETRCKEEKPLDSCKEECSEKCLAGEDTWIEPEREQHKEEKFVFTAGGSCRKVQEKTESSIWFGGWTGDKDDEFNNFYLIKNKYYSYGGREWCEEELKDLLMQRKELENSLNEEFARWFFEKYVANSAEKWEEHISGIFDIYWGDVDISRQITERLQCLNKNSLPSYKLISFEYETEYGDVKFWEEIKTTNEFGEREKEIISPYMEISLFPSREFFKLELKNAMNNHELPGPPEEEKRNALSEEEKQELRNDEKFMDTIRKFNEKYGENFVLQLTDFETNEIIFNIHMRINENELIYAEPKPAEENPQEFVKAELNVDRILDIVEYEERGRVELHSPPWDKQPETGFVENVVDGTRMYMMFRSLMNSMVVTPKNAKNDAKFFTRQFFERVMGDERHEDIEGGPGGCQSERECRKYCENPRNKEECEKFMDDESSIEGRDSLTGEIVRR